VTARDDLLRAAAKLAGQGHLSFTAVELIAEARSLGSTYPDITLRTMLTYHLRVDEGRAGPGEGFYRLSRARYALAPDAGGTTSVPAPPARLTTQPAEPSHEVDPEDDWRWEGRVQATVVRWLAAEGWDILRVADTASRERGVDIEARRHGQRLLVEVKGYPSPTYQRGAAAGEPKRYGAATQGRTYFGNALLSGMLMRTDDPDAGVTLAFPDVPTFRGLAERTAVPLRAAGISVWLVAQDGTMAAVAPKH
jgi:hypothetical protein